jgi:hypothetical protein
VVLDIPLSGANVIKQYHGNLLPFHNNYFGNIALYHRMIVLQITTVKSCITNAPSGVLKNPYLKKKCFSYLRKFTAVNSKNHLPILMTVPRISLINDFTVLSKSHKTTDTRIFFQSINFFSWALYYKTFYGSNFCRIIIS